MVGDWGYNSGMDSDHREAIQAVVDRISSYQESAPRGTVAHELQEGLREAGLDVAPEDITALISAIEDNEGQVSVAEVLA